jgi:GAF domain-containing protein
MATSIDLRLPDETDLARMLRAGASLSELLDEITRAGEGAVEGVICSILLLDAEGRHLLHGSAPSLPRIYNDAVNGLEIGPGIGCCGQAAATRKRVVIDNLQTHPNWAPFIELARVAGIASSASEPILSSDHSRVLGTYAIYHRTAGVPSMAEYALMERGAALARFAIEESLMGDAVTLRNGPTALTRSAR